MTREYAKQNLISMGIEEPTEEQVSSYLNQLNGEIKKEKDKASEYKKKADHADELQKKLDELESNNLTEIEKANKALETANQQIEQMRRDNAIREQRESAMVNFKIDAEQAKVVVKDDGTLDYAELGKIMSDKENAAAKAKELEIANGSTNPGGSNTNGNKNGDKPADVLNAEKITFGNSAAEESGKNYYVL